MIGIHSALFSRIGCDTNEWVYYDNNGCWLALFPIFDTMGMHIERPSTSCPPTTTMRVIDINENTTTLFWNADGHSQWDVSYGVSGTPPNFGSVFRTYSTVTTIENLDTATWYVAYVRTVCGDDQYSTWSDSVRFYVPSYDSGGGSGGDTLGDDGISVTDVDRFTYIMPNPATTVVSVASSFGITDIELYSLDGKLLARRDIGTLSASVDLTPFPAGSYILRIDTPKGYTARKLVIRR